MSDEALILRMKLFNDGGPVFKHLTNIQNSSARNNRALQLLYLGLITESERLSPTGGVMATAAIQVQSAAPTTVPAESKREVALPTFDDADIATTFGL